jgi:hypothetical protein
MVRTTLHRFREVSLGGASSLARIRLFRRRFFDCLSRQLSPFNQDVDVMGEPVEQRAG